MRALQKIVVSGYNGTDNSVRYQESAWWTTGDKWWYANQVWSVDYNANASAGCAAPNKLIYCRAAMMVTKLPWLTLSLLTVAITLAVGCSRTGAAPTGGVHVDGTPPDGGTLLSRSTSTPPTTAEPQRYSTRELELASRSPPGMTLWEGKVIYSDVGVASQPGEATTSRIVEHDLATGREAVLIEARLPRTSAYVLHRSGDWLFYSEGGTTESGPAAFNPPRDYYALNLRTGSSQHMVMLQGRSCIGYPSGPNLSGCAFGEHGFAYIAANRSGGECRDQLRLYDLETGQDRLLFEVESADTVLDSPLLRDNAVVDLDQVKDRPWRVFMTILE